MSTPEVTKRVARSKPRTLRTYVRAVAKQQADGCAISKNAVDAVTELSQMIAQRLLDNAVDVLRASGSEGQTLTFELVQAAAELTFTDAEQFQMYNQHAVNAKGKYLASRS